MKYRAKNSLFNYSKFNQSRESKLFQFSVYFPENLPFDENFLTPQGWKLRDIENEQPLPCCRTSLVGAYYLLF
jgi:hypothetical protein